MDFSFGVIFGQKSSVKSLSITKVSKYRTLNKSSDTGLKSNFLQEI